MSKGNKPSASHTRAMADCAVIDQLVTQLTQEKKAMDDLMHNAEDLADLKTVGDIMDEVRKLRAAIRLHQILGNTEELYALFPENRDE